MHSNFMCCWKMLHHHLSQCGSISCFRFLLALLKTIIISPGLRMSFNFFTAYQSWILSWSWNQMEGTCGLTIVHLCLNIVWRDVYTVYWFKFWHRGTGEALVIFLNHNDLMIGLQRDKQHMGRRYIEVFQVREKERPRYIYIYIYIYYKTHLKLAWCWFDLDTSLQAKRSEYYNAIASQVQAGTAGGDPRMMGCQTGTMQIGVQSNYSTSQGQQMVMGRGMLNSGMYVVF